MTEQYNFKKVETDRLRGDYLEVVEGEKGIVITAYNHKGEVEEIITKDTIKNFKMRK